MPRHPRPIHRIAPRKTKNLSKEGVWQKISAKSKRAPALRPSESAVYDVANNTPLTSPPEEPSDHDGELLRSGVSDGHLFEEERDIGDDPDVSRAACWVDEEELEEQASDREIDEDQSSDKHVFLRSANPSRRRLVCITIFGGAFT
jgi:hypothetical protein